MQTYDEAPRTEGLRLRLPLLTLMLLLSSRRMDTLFISTYVVPRLNRKHVGELDVYAIPAVRESHGLYTNYRDGLIGSICALGTRSAVQFS